MAHGGATFKGNRMRKEKQLKKGAVLEAEVVGSIYVGKLAQGSEFKGLCNC